MKSKIFFTLISVIATITTAGAVNVGDKVTLRETASTYATGERIPQRFLGKTYTVQQVGSKQHPDGVLLQEIYSWVKVADVPVATKEQEKNVLHRKLRTLFRSPVMRLMISPTRFLSTVSKSMPESLTA